MGEGWMKMVDRGLSRTSVSAGSVCNTQKVLKDLSVYTPLFSSSAHPISTLQEVARDKGASLGFLNPPTLITRDF